MKHSKKCAREGEVARDYCEDIHAEQARYINELHMALTAIYSIAGENAEIAAMCRTAILESGGEWGSESRAKAMATHRVRDAAPDLLAALLALREALRRSFVMAGPEFNGLGIQVNNAIYKATGQST